MQRREKPNPFSAKSRQPEPVDLRDVDESDEYYDEYEEEAYDEQDEERRVFGLGIQPSEERQPAYGQGIVFALIIASALLLCAIIAIGDGDGSIPPMLQRATPLLWGVSLLALVLSAVGAQYSESVARKAMAEFGAESKSTWFGTAWVVPFVSVFAATLLVATYHNRWMLLFGPALAFLGMAGALFTRDLLEEGEESNTRAAFVISSVVGIIVAFFAFGAIYINKFNSIIAVPLVAIVAFLLLLEALDRAGVPTAERVLHAGLGAWIVAASMIALNWWPTWGWGGGAVLTAVYYMVYGLLITNAEGKPLTRNKMLEFVGVGSVILLIVALRDVIL